MTAACLEARFAQEVDARATISQILLTNASEVGDDATYERVALRLATEVDPTSGNQAFRLALWYETRSRHADALTWGERALLNRARLDYDEDLLHKMCASDALALWTEAKERGDEDAGARFRGIAAEHAAAWVALAEDEKERARALELCRYAGGCAP